MSSDAARLRVAAGLSLPRRRMNYGHGRAWIEALRHLSRLVHLELIEPRYLPRRITPLRRPDVWLVNGHADPPDVTGPAVIVFHEVSWQRAELRDQLLPTWAELHARTSAATMAIAQRVLTPSTVTADEVVEAFAVDAGIVDMVPYGVDVRRFRPGAGNGLSIVARSARRSVESYVLYTGSLLPRKNLDSLRQAMAALAADGFPQSLVIVGSESPDRTDADELRRRASGELPGAPGRVVRIDAPIPQRRLVSLMAGAAAFCVPSLYEGFGLVALEGLACGAPTVVSDRGALPEVVGDAGIIVEPTPDGIEAGLRAILSDPSNQARLRRAGRARAESLTWGRTAEGWMQSLIRAADR